MRELVIRLPRRVIPRWRDFATTAALGELGALRQTEQYLPPRADIEAAKNRWATLKTPWTAGDLLMAALVERDWEALIQSANYLVKDDIKAQPFIKDIARQALQWASVQTVFPLVSPSAIEAPVFNPRIIGVVRRTLKSFPESPVHWIELALGYAIIGKTEKAKRAILAALYLAPNDRFVLRCATRFFLHQEDPESAMQVLEKSPRTASDSWLLAAHLSVAAILGESSKLHKQARSTFASQAISPFHLSELGSALATAELAEGSDKKARKMFKQALVAPTENALAQALWAKNHVVLEQQENLLHLPLSFEANARVLVQTEQWKQALTATQSWQNDEPFSARPAILGSFLASSAMDDFHQAEHIAQVGLLANPGEPTLVNNLAFAQANLGKIEEAAKTLAQFSADELHPEQEVALIATQGMIEFRSGNIDAGRAKYRHAIELARTHKLSSHLVRAAVHHAREELRINPATALDAVGEAASLVRSHEDLGVKLVISKLNRELRGAGMAEIELPLKKPRTG